MTIRRVTTIAIAILLTTTVTLQASLIGLWNFDEAAGTVASNSAGPSPNGALNNGAAFVDDAGRGRVVNLPGVDGFVDLGSVTIPQMTLTNDFTWSFWALNEQGGNNNVVLGNRFMPAGGDFSPREFIKFTNRQFEFHRNGGGDNLDYADMPTGQWLHHVIVKDGDQLTYYRDGTVAGTHTITQGLNNPQPLYVGGDKTNENWVGRVDDVAIFDEALDADQIFAVRNQDFSAFGGAGNLTGINAPVQTTAQSSTGFTVGSGDLLDGLVATVVGNVNPEESQTTSDVSALTNGAFGDPGLTGGANVNEVVAIHNDTTLTYLLDISNTPQGFDIDSIETYAGWRDAGRDGQEYSVQVAFVDDLNNFVGVTTTAFNPSAGQGASDTMITLMGLDGNPIAMNVGAIRFVFDDTENGYVGYREIDVFGAASIVPEPTTAALGLIGLAGLARRRRRHAA